MKFCINETLHTKINAFRVAAFVVAFPNMVVKPNISTSGDWNAINIAMLSSRYQQHSNQIDENV